MEKLEYTNGDITIIWQPKLCIHSGVCVRRLPNVYHPKERPWITPENASSEEIVNQVAQCPSKALTIKNQNNMIEIKQNETQFEIFYDGKKAGLMQYQWKNDDVFVITHTEVDEVFGGKGLGKELVKAGVEFARANNKKIIPLCPFAKKVIDRTPEFQDVL